MNTSILNRDGQIDINQCIEENAKAVKVVGKLKLHKKSGDIGGLVHVKIRLQQLGDQRNQRNQRNQKNFPMPHS